MQRQDNRTLRMLAIAGGWVRAAIRHLSVRERRSLGWNAFRVCIDTFNTIHRETVR